MQYLKANDAATILIGPFVDKGDGVTPEEGVTLAGADSAELMKHDGTTFVDLTSDSRAFTHKEKGMYTLVLGTGDTDTEGRLTVFISDESVCLPVWKDFMVLAEAAYDSLFAAKDTGYMDIDVKAVGGTATPHTSGKLHVLNDAGSSIPVTAMRGTDNAALASAWTAALATVLGNYTAVRAGYLDQLDFALQEAIAAIVGDATAANQLLLIKILTNKWEITGNQLIMYDDDGITPLYTFDLTRDGSASEFNPDLRSPV